MLVTPTQFNSSTSQPYTQQVQIRRSAIAGQQLHPQVQQARQINASGRFSTFNSLQGIRFGSSTIPSSQDSHAKDETHRVLNWLKTMVEKGLKIKFVFDYDGTMIPLRKDLKSKRERLQQPEYAQYIKDHKIDIKNDWHVHICDPPALASEVKILEQLAHHPMVKGVSFATARAADQIIRYFPQLQGSPVHIISGLMAEHYDFKENKKTKFLDSKYHDAITKLIENLKQDPAKSGLPFKIEPQPTVQNQDFYRLILPPGTQGEAYLEIKPYAICLHRKDLMNQISPHARAIADSLPALKQWMHKYQDATFKVVHSGPTAQELELFPDLENFDKGLTVPFLQKISGYHQDYAMMTMGDSIGDEEAPKTDGQLFKATHHHFPEKSATVWVNGNGDKKTSFVNFRVLTPKQIYHLLAEFLKQHPADRAAQV
ncbi:MAG: hypothetical protein KTR14_03175 [Vampirovibrio sp.]|nr:hypothetical protein [Vampirovibrio sp.]